jgi:hypothetical protein
MGVGVRVVSQTITMILVIKFPTIVEQLTLNFLRSSTTLDFQLEA